MRGAQLASRAHMRTVGAARRTQVLEQHAAFTAQGLRARACAWLRARACTSPHVHGQQPRCHGMRTCTHLPHAVAPMLAGTLKLGSDRGKQQCVGAAAVPFLAMQLLGPDLFELAQRGAFRRDAAGCARLARVGVAMVKVRVKSLHAQDERMHGSPQAHADCHATGCMLCRGARMVCAAVAHSMHACTCLAGARVHAQQGHCPR